MTTTSVTSSTTTITLTTATIQNTTSMILTSASNANWIVNGDGETGSCASNVSMIVHPTGWQYNGSITQVYYNMTNGDLKFTDPGPSDRGQCYFYGQVSTVTSMWQTANLTSSVDPFLIDNQTVWFNFSAWMGGWQSQNDNARVSLTFTNQTNQKVGNSITLGPVLAAHRGSQSSLLFRQTNGFVPVGARSFLVTVTITCVNPSYNDGDIDNIVLLFYQY